MGVSPSDVLAPIKLIPDVMEAKLTGRGEQAELCYREYYTYLPNEVRDFFAAVGIRLFELYQKLIGCDVICKRIEQGIQLDVKGPPITIARTFMPEILIFGATNMDEARILTESSLESERKTLSTGIILRSWDANAKNVVEPLIAIMKKQMQLLGLSSFDELMREIIKQHSKLGD
jgi:hypothetical protein